MSRVDDLIKELCPNGVEFKKLKNLGVRNKGIGITAAKMRELDIGRGIRVFAGGATIAHIEETSLDASKIIKEPSIIVKSRGHIGFDYCDVPFTHKSELWSYTLNSPLIDQKFVYHLLNSQKSYFQSLAEGTSVKIPQLSIRDTDEHEIPVPPLEIQQEIARILDKFTQLEARRKQYAYYREQLLTFPETGGQPLKLADVCRRISTGATPKAGSRKYYENGTIPWLRTAEVSFNTIYSTETAITEAALAETGVSWVEAQSIIVAISGATAGRSAVTAIPLTTNQHCCNMAIDSEKADFRYVFHWLGAHYEDLKKRGRGARADLNLSIIKNFPIVLPPLEEQRRIVAILDKFDALVNDISTGLPAEIAARRKQYEYYRDKLLSFEPV